MKKKQQPFYRNKHDAEQIWQTNTYAKPHTRTRTTTQSHTNSYIFIILFSHPHAEHINSYTNFYTFLTPILQTDFNTLIRIVFFHLHKNKHMHTLTFICSFIPVLNKHMLTLTFICSLIPIINKHKKAWPNFSLSDFMKTSLYYFHLSSYVPL